MTDSNVTYAGCGACEMCGEVDPCVTCVGDWIPSDCDIDKKVLRLSPPTITGTKKGDIALLDTLGDMGALAGSAQWAYEDRKKW